MSFQEGVSYALEGSLSSGAEVVTVSATVVCRLSPSSFAAQSRVQRLPFVVRLREDIAPTDGVVSLFQFSLARDDGVLFLHQESASLWTLHEPLQAHHYVSLKETCAGIGALGMGAIASGFQVSMLNELQPITCQLLRQIATAPVIEGDVGSQDVLRQMWDNDPRPAVLSAGVACQPYSRLGDRRGGRDPRALSLPHVLQAALVLQSSAVVIECVAQAAQDTFVRTCLQTFCAATGYHCSEILLELSDVWCAHRLRWWCVLTPPSLAPCPLQAWEKGDAYRSVGDVMHFTLPVTSDLASLELTPYELRQFSDRRPLASFLLQATEAMPTSLHSTACQVYPCPCGCRKQPFTDARLDQSLLAVITPCHGEGFQLGSKYRHLAPAELALLNGLTPRGPWGAHPRLAACLIGQLASPLQSAWVFAHLRALAHSRWPSYPEPSTPLQVLEGAKQLLLREAVELGLRAGDGNPPAVHSLPEEPPQVSASSANASDLIAGPSAGDANTTDLGLAQPIFTAGAQHWEPDDDDASVIEPPVLPSVDTTWKAGDTPGPSQALRPAPYHVAHGGTRMREVVADVRTTAWQLAQSICAANFFPWQLRTREDRYVSPHEVLQPGDLLRFTHVAFAEGISLPLTFMMPLPDQVSALQRPAITCLARARLLHMQKDRLADDQVDYMLQEIAQAAPCTLVVIEVAHLLSAVQHQAHAVLEQRLREVRLLADFGIIGAIPVAGHWITFAWMCGPESVAAWSSYAPHVADNLVDSANCIMGRAVHRTLSQFRFLDGPIRPLNGPHCGRFALADLKSLVMSTPYLGEATILSQFQDRPAGLLPPSCDGLVVLPTCLASGQEFLEHGLAATLREKGVPEDQVHLRATAAIAALGAAKIQQAMQSKAPWRELKAVANQATPVFQFVLPSELELALKAKMGDGRPVPSKRKQKQAPAFAVQMPRKRHDLLPALDQVVVPTGVFTSAVGDLDHLSPSDIGPHAKGVVLLEHQAALPYTQIAKPVSSSALGLLVPGQHEVEGAFLPGVSLRFTAKLVGSGEPILLSAHLYLRSLEVSSTADLIGRDHSLIRGQDLPVP